MFMERMVGFCRAIAAAALVVAGLSSTLQAAEVDFDELPLAENSYWNGSDLSGGFTSGGASFNNNFTDWGGGETSWDGWAYSNVNDTTTPGYENQYAAVTGADFSGAGNYAVAYVSAWALTGPTITLPGAAVLDSIWVTNTTYAALDMASGSGFTKKFGGDSGDDADWFLLTITGMNASGEVGAVEFYLADYRFADNGQDYIAKTWTEIDLSSLSGSTALTFGLASSDNGDYGMNTPAYFAVDNLTYAANHLPEPSTLLLVAIGALVSLAFRRFRLR